MLPLRRTPRRSGNADLDEPGGREDDCAAIAQEGADGVLVFDALHRHKATNAMLYAFHLLELEAGLLLAP